MCSWDTGILSLGGKEYSVDASLLTFVNHGCNGTSNVGIGFNVTEVNARDEFMPLELQSRPHGKDFIYNPIEERNSFYTKYMKPVGNIAMGEEILTNYLSYVGGDQFWSYTIAELRSWDRSNCITRRNRFRTRFSFDWQQSLTQS